MTTIPLSAIQASYLWPCNAAHAAFTLSETHGVKITPRSLQIRWDNECADHPLFRELGQRPVKGFARTKAVELAQRLINADVSGRAMA